MTFDGKAFGAEIVGVVKGYLQQKLAPISSRLDELEKRIGAIPAPVDLSSDLAAVKEAVEAIKVPEIPPALAPPDIAKMIDDALAARFDVDDREKRIEHVVRAVLDEIPKPKDGEPGTSVSIEDVLPTVERRVNEFLSAIPAPQDGKSVAVEDIAPLIAAEVEKRVGVAGAFIDRDGGLVVTLNNGEVKNLGLVVGKDGEPGRDGFLLTDFDAGLMEDGRTVLLSFDGGEQSFKVELGFPVMIYRGVFKDEEKYECGDTVTWGGSLWHCDNATEEKPGDGSKAWTLCVKKGRDGKDGELKETRRPEPVRVGTPARAD